MQFFIVFHSLIVTVPAEPFSVKLALIMDEEDVIVLSSDRESGSTGSLVFTPTKRPPSPVRSPTDSGDER